MKFVQKVKLNAVPVGTELIHALHANMAAYEPPRPATRIHASDITNEETPYCPREHALADLFPDTRKPKAVGTALRYTFDMGNSLAELLCNKWALPIAVGDWTCVRCNQLHTFQKRPGWCSSCGAEDAFRYEEVRFISKTSGASGGIDLLVDLNTGPLEVVELKSIKADDFKTLMAPKPEHRLRTNLYLRLIEDSDHPMRGHINTERARVLYMMKGFGVKTDGMKFKHPDTAFSPFKEFSVVRDDTATGVYMNKARALKLFRETGTIPSGICPNVLCKRAQGCSSVKACFSGKYDPGTVIKLKNLEPA